MSERITIAIDPDIAELVPGFLDNRRRDVERLRNLVATRGFAEARLLGHSMKGSGGGYGFDAITDIGAAIERAALAEDVAAIEAGVERLADFLARVDVVLGG